MNLVVNARDAVRDIGRISIKTENYYADDTKTSYGCVPVGEYAKLTISDSGCGIPSEAVQKIFDPFFTTKSTDKKRGSGLGLSVVAAVVKDHDGYIDFTTRVGVGTSFYLYIPLTRESVNEDPSSEIPRGSETILVVDDDEIQRDVSARLLTTLGYRVTTCGSGKMAVEMLASSSFDLLVLDMIMPDDLDGAETYRQALQIRPDQKAVIVSGFSESDRVAVAQECGAGAFVKKPFSRKVIALAVRHELDRHVVIPARA
jgi:CheY-like chemotaxis protein